MIELEKQLQWREIAKKENVIQETKKTIEKTKQKTIISEEEQIAFRQRLEEAKKKAAQISLKRDEEEANILRYGEIIMIYPVKSFNIGMNLGPGTHRNSRAPLTK